MKPFDYEATPDRAAVPESLFIYLCRDLLKSHGQLDHLVSDSYFQKGDRLCPIQAITIET
jgi:hypothetical protein